MTSWIDKLKVGPWFLLDHFTGTDPKYRGRDSTADVSLAMSFAGHMNIELIQPNDDAPSVYQEWIARRGYGFHHWGRATSNFERDIERFQAAGHDLVFTPGCRAAATWPIWIPPPSCRATSNSSNSRWIRACVQQVLSCHHRLGWNRSGAFLHLTQTSSNASDKIAASLAQRIQTSEIVVPTIHDVKKLPLRAAAGRAH